MREDELKVIVNAEMKAATGYIGGELSETRRKSLDYYFGEPFGNEQEGRSSFVMSEVRDVVESMLPGLIEVFLAGGEAVSFQPVMPDDEKSARQATDVINHIFLKENDGYHLLYQAFKDALIQKVGLVKVWWDDTPTRKAEFLTGAPIEVAYLADEDPDAEILQATEVEGGFDLKIARSLDNGRIRVEGVPPEEFLIARRAKSIEDAHFVAHRVKKTRSELINMGFDEKKVLAIPTDDAHEYNEERTARYQNDDEWPFETTRTDILMQSVWVIESYIRVDYDNDKLTELRKVTSDTDATVILENVEVSHCPIVDFHCLPMPHKFFGLSMADLTMDLQRISSTVTRQILDNMYLVNNGRTLVSDRVHLDDMLANRPGQVVRVMSGGVSDAAMPLVTPPLGNQAYPLLEYLNGVRETRTGVTRYNQGLDADSLNKTATGVNMISQMAQKRQQLVARNLSRGVRKLFKLMNKLFIDNMDRAKTFRLRDDFVDVDPRSWNADMDVTVEVGLGHGTRDQNLQAVMQILMSQKEIIAQQGGLEGPLVTGENLYASLKQAAAWSGLPNPEQYFSDPSTPEMQQALEQKKQQPNPDMEKIKIEAQKAKAEQEFNQGKLQVEMKNIEAREQSDRARNQVQMYQLELDAQRVQIEQARAQSEIERGPELEKAYADIELAREKAQNEIDMKQAKFDHDAMLAEEKSLREDEASLAKEERADFEMASKLAREQETPDVQQENV